MYKCSKCGRHKERIKILEVDSKTKKKWYILTCPDCNYKSDIEDYKTSKSLSHNPSPSYFYPSAEEGTLEDSGEVDDSEGLPSD